jgi:hypothetical protein
MDSVLDQKNEYSKNGVLQKNRGKFFLRGNILTVTVKEKELGAK